MKNHTAWNKADLRALVVACSRWLGLAHPPPSTFVYARVQGSTGHAWHSGPIRIRVTSPYPAPRRWRRWDAERACYVVETIARASNVVEPTEGGVPTMKPALFLELAWVIEHEILHVKGWSHARMRREKHPARLYAAGFPAELPTWARNRRVRVAESRLTRKPAAGLTPEERTEKRVAGAALAAEKRAAKDVAALARWTRKLKLATTKVKALRRRIAARERRKGEP